MLASLFLHAIMKTLMGSLLVHKMSFFHMIEMHFSMSYVIAASMMLSILWTSLRLGSSSG